MSPGIAGALSGDLSGAVAIEPRVLQHFRWHARPGARSDEQALQTVEPGSHCVLSLAESQCSSAFPSTNRHMST